LHADWRSIARRAGYPVDASDTVTVKLEGGGSQVVSFRLDTSNNALRAMSVIARPSVLAAASIDSSYRYAWERNRLSDLVGFSVDGRGRLVGHAWIPLEGLTPEEIGLYLSELARVCDWHEFRLSGEDVF
jgi:hypothetical protein